MVWEVTLLELGKTHYVVISGEAVMPLVWVEADGSYLCRRHVRTRDRDLYDKVSFQPCELETEDAHKERLKADGEALAKVLRNHGILIAESELVPPKGGGLLA